MVSGDNDVKQGSWCNWVQSNGAIEECGRCDSSSGANGTANTMVQLNSVVGTMIKWCNWWYNAAIEYW